MNTISRWLRNHPLISDGALALVLFLAGSRFFRHSTSLAVAVPIVLLLTVPLLFRRRWPVHVFALVSAAALVQFIAGIEIGAADIAVLVAVYTVAAYVPNRSTVGVCGFIVVALNPLFLLRRHGEHPLADAIVAVTVTALALALGMDRRVRRAYFAELEARATRLERERDVLAALAAAAERARIARDLHDVVAHSLTVMVAQADGASYIADTDPGRARDAMTTVAETGRTALVEMRRLLGVLGSAPAGGDRAPQPGLDAIPALVDAVRAAGLPVTLSLDAPAHPLPAGMELAIYRIVQEALTNTMKHSGPGATATAAVRLRGDVLTVEVTDDGAGIRSALHDSAGRGIDGMRERTTMYGGTFRSGPRPDGGFEVAAQFPLNVKSSA